MSTVIHNPDQYMAALRTIIAQGRKRIGLLVGAGAPAGMKNDNGDRFLIPAVAGLTEKVLTTVDPIYNDDYVLVDGEYSSIRPAVSGRKTIASGLCSRSSMIPKSGSRFFG
jgi:hypothetical protein